MHTLIWQKEPAIQPIEILRGGGVLGEMWLASTPIGICQLEFIMENNTHAAENYLKKYWPSCPITFSKNTLDTQALLTKTHALHVRGTDFQQKVWRELIKIPQGKTKSYGDIAAAINKPTAFRAVGGAVGRNPVAVLIPCHRVLAANKQPGGFAWGIALKKSLLKTEGVLI